MNDFSKGNFYIAVDSADTSPMPKIFLHLIPTEACIKEVRRHRKRRINKKWVKRYGKKLIPSNMGYFFKNHLIAHPKMIEKIVHLVSERKGFKVVSLGTDFNLDTTQNYIDVNSEEV